MNELPPLPPGFTLDAQGDVPPLPPGFTLDAPAQAALSGGADTMADSEARGLPPLPKRPASTWDVIRTEPLGQLAHGFGEASAGLFQIPVNYAALATGNEGLTNFATTINRRMAENAKSYDEAMKATHRTEGGQINPGVGIGRMLPTAPLAMLGLGPLAAGALYGATSPVTNAENPSDYAKQNVTNAAMGAVLAKGADLVGKGISYATSKSISPEDRAKQMVSEAFRRDRIDPQSASDLMSRYSDKDATLLEGGGQNVQRLARNVYTLPGEGSQKLEKFLTERQADQHNRVLSDIRQNLADGTNVLASKDALTEAQRINASPLFRDAFRANQNVASPEIDKILETPAGKTALANARYLMQNDRSLMGIPDAELRDQALEAGQAIPRGGVASGLKMRTLHYVKMAMDDMIGAAQRANEGTKAKILIGLKNDLKNEMIAADVTAQAGPNSTRAAGGLYERALKTFADDAQAKDAIDAGVEFLKQDPRELAKTVAGLTGDKLDYFRKGAAKALQDRVGSTRDNLDAVSRIFGNKTIRAQIETVFGRDGAAKLADAMTGERLASGTKNMVMGNSNTASKLADMEDRGVKYAKDAAVGMLTGGPQAALAHPLLTWAKDKIHSYNGLTPEVRNAISDLLTKTGAAPNLVPQAPVRALNGPLPAQLSPMLISRLPLLLSH